MVELVYFPFNAEKKIQKSTFRPSSWLRKASISRHGKGNLENHKEVKLDIWYEIYVKLAASNPGKEREGI